MAGIEMIAFKNRGDKWQIKTGVCSMCGKCCMTRKNNYIFPVIDGKCVYLENPEGYGDKWVCGLGGFRPIACSVSNPIDKYCTVKFKYVE